MATQKSPEKKSGLRNILLVVLALFFLMLMTTGVAYVVAKNIASSNEKVVENPKNHITYDAGEFLTNLADKGYVKLSMVYLLNGKDVEKELEIKDSEVRDKVFTILRSKNHDSVRDSNGMEELRKEIKECLNQLLNSGEIVDVFFTSIIVN
ncbi:MAG: flagellar basal body-associated FliL family protein [Tepidanaerobacteraceae bacterium]|nr:flagellar basal body protein FliL [Tepidanaerobacter sp.]HQA60310.1 flagellar basal body-associated FliL family protein [Tepidanaerobacteraceae bacterium]HQE05243.1 flagellar basal body-associated FliL family protein [Tepidanaerobacteraceae bacterium]